MSETTKAGSAMTGGGHVSEEDLVLFLYGEAPDARAIDAHLDACAACHGACDEIRTTLAAVTAVDADETPVRSAAYGAQVWARIEPRLSRGRFEWLRAPWAPRFALAVVLVLMLLAAFLAGRFSRTEIEVPAGPISQEARDRILLLAMDGHLERAQAMLAEIANLNGLGQQTHADGPPPGVDISSDRNRAAELVTAGRIYRRTASLAGEAGLELLLDELERILTDITHAPDEITRDELHAIQKRIADRGILLKIRAMGSQVRQREKERRETGRTFL